MIDFPTLADVLEIHARQLRRFGGAPGVRDLGLVEAALFRPQTGYYSDLIEHAAALWESLSQNHPFVDGNKRVAFAVTDAFLRTNGLRITASPDAIFMHVMALYAEGQFRFEELDTWLRSNTTQATG